jgi:hypothetical protein
MVGKTTLIQAIHIQKLKTSGTFYSGLLFTYLGLFIDVKVHNIPKNLAIETPLLKSSTTTFCVKRTTLRAGF